MTSYERGDVVLATLPFSDLTGLKKRPAVVVSAPHPSVDLVLLPLTSQLENLQLARIIHDGSLRNRAVALRDRHAEP
jgi:mRNA interferase MazF